MATQADDEDRLIFLGVYFVAMIVMGIISLLVGKKDSADEEASLVSRPAPPCFSAQWFADKCGVVDEDTGNQLGV